MNKSLVALTLSLLSSCLNLNQPDLDTNIMLREFPITYNLNYSDDDVPLREDLEVYVKVNNNEPLKERIKTYMTMSDNGEVSFQPTISTTFLRELNEGENYVAIDLITPELTLTNKYKFKKEEGNIEVYKK